MCRILIVEDDELSRDMLSRRLQRRGYHILIALDGIQAILAATEEQPDLIVMDMSLPLMDGWQATRLLKAGAATAHIPIIGLSAHALAGDREKALQAGCDEYESKPLNLDTLLEKMRVLVYRKEVG